MKTLLFVLLLCGAAQAHAELPMDEAVYTESDASLLGGENGDDAHVILVKQYVGPGTSYSNSDGVSWENGVCQHGCRQGDHDDTQNDQSFARRKQKRD